MTILSKTDNKWFIDMQAELAWMKLELRRLEEENFDLKQQLAHPPTPSHGYQQDDWPGYYEWD